MSISIKKLNPADETRIGEYAAKQPLSGTNIVTKSFISGAGSNAFVRIENTKKAG